MGDEVKTVPKIKHDWYQTDTKVVITILLKNAKQEDVNIIFGRQSLSVTVKLPTGSEYNLELDVANPIDTERSSFKILPSKIEIYLQKLDGTRWAVLEGDPKVETVKPIPKEIFASIPAASTVTSYPSSHKKRVDWDAIERELKEEEKKEKPEGEAALNALFQQIYGQGSDEVKKAMNKSFLESGGTVLSTNWNEVGNKKIDCNPPEGMEFKKWDQ